MKLTTTFIITAACAVILACSSADSTGGRLAVAQSGETSEEKPLDTSRDQLYDPVAQSARAAIAQAAVTEFPGQPGLITGVLPKGESWHAWLRNPEGFRQGKETLSRAEAAQAIRLGGGKTFRSGAVDQLVSYFALAGLPVQTKEHLADFIVSTDVREVSCSEWIDKIQSMGRISDSGIMDFNFDRKVCYPGERFLVWFNPATQREEAFLSLGCGNPIKMKPAVRSNCVFIYVEVNDESGSPVRRNTTLTTYLWGDSVRLAKIRANDECFGVWDKDRTRMWSVRPTCDTCALDYERRFKGKNKLIADRRGEGPSDAFDFTIENGAGWISVGRENIDPFVQNPTELFICSRKTLNVMIATGKPNRGYSITAARHIARIWKKGETPVSDPVSFVKFD